MRPRRSSSQPRRCVADDLAVELAAEAVVAEAVAEELAVEASRPTPRATRSRCRARGRGLEVDELPSSSPRRPSRRGGRGRAAEEASSPTRPSSCCGRDASRTSADERPAARPRPLPRTLPRPIAVAITGGIGAGKSDRSRGLPRHGAATVSSDEIVHHLLAHRPEVRDALVERFGEEILGDDGVPDRARDRARSSSTTLRRSPSWRRSCTRLSPANTWPGGSSSRASTTRPRVCVTEVPLLFEVGRRVPLRPVVVITAPRSCVSSAGTCRSTTATPGCSTTARRSPARTTTTSTRARYEDLDAWVAGVMAELTNDDS